MVRAVCQDGSWRRESYLLSCECQGDRIESRFNTDFRRAPWLTAYGKSPAQLIDENIRMCTMAMKERLGIRPNGFRTPGGFTNGLKDRPDVQNMLLSQGYNWVSSMYARHPIKPDTGAPQPGELEAITAQQEASQPFVYPSGLG